LSANIPQKVVFGDAFNYLSESNRILVRYFLDFARLISEKYGLSKNDLVCDIGSNDGSLLLQFKNRGIRTIGVEPTIKPATRARERGIVTIRNFFGPKTAQRILRVYGKPRVITAMNVLAHTDDVHGFLHCVRSMMDENTLFLSQSHYLPSLLEKMEYDMIYHEHSRYYTLTTLTRLFELHGIHIVDAELNSIHGGSVLAFATTSQVRPSQNVTRITEREKRYQKFRAYAEFANRVRKNRTDLRQLLEKLASEGKTIVGIGAPMRASTILNYCHIDKDLLRYLTEVNELKIGKYSPGVHIPIVAENQIVMDRPDCGLVLSWSIADDIMKNLRKMNYKGDFIVPIPKLKLVRHKT
jgi:hypothetical protein